METDYPVKAIQKIMMGDFDTYSNGSFNFNFQLPKQLTLRLEFAKIYSSKKKINFIFRHNHIHLSSDTLCFEYTNILN